MLEAGAIRPSNSPWCNAVVLVCKKDGGLHFCIDFRNLNAKTKKDSYPLPCIQETLDSLVRARVFSMLDLKSVISGVFGLLKGWFVGCTSCTLQTLLCSANERFLVLVWFGILIYRVLHLSLRCDSWHASYAINLVKIIQSACTYYLPFIIHTNLCNTVVSQCSSDNLVA